VKTIASVLTAAVLTALSLSQAEARTETPAVTPVLQIAGGAAYRKQPLVLELEFRNQGEPRLVLDPAAFGPEAFTLVDAKGRPARRSGEAPPPDKGLEVDGYATVKRPVDLSAWFPKVTSKKNSVWTVTWSHAGMKAGPLRVAIIPAHDPKKDRQAIVDTTLGRMTWTLLPGQAPRHVKRFVDLSRQGFYDGLTIFRVIPGIQAEGGDPRGDGTGAWETLLPPEIAGPNLPMGPGLVGAARQETSMTSETMFFITLGPSDFMKGFQTFFARVTDGMEILGRLQTLDSRGNTEMRDAFLLIEPVTIRKIEIR
jgi:cyclophilin family peptidyl-prolyl cis-trans isomerase